MAYYQTSKRTQGRDEFVGLDEMEFVDSGISGLKCTHWKKGEIPRLSEQELAMYSEKSISPSKGSIRYPYENHSPNHSSTRNRGYGDFDDEIQASQPYYYPPQSSVRGGGTSARMYFESSPEVRGNMSNLNGSYDPDRGVFRPDEIVMPAPPPAELRSLKSTPRRQDRWGSNGGDGSVISMGQMSFMSEASNGTLRSEPWRVDPSTSQVPQHLAEKVVSGLGVKENPEILRYPYDGRQTKRSLPRPIPSPDTSEEDRRREEEARRRAAEEDARRRAEEAVADRRKQESEEEARRRAAERQERERREAAEADEERRRREALAQLEGEEARRREQAEDRASVERQEKTKRGFNEDEEDEARQRLVVEESIERDSALDRERHRLQAERDREDQDKLRKALEEDEERKRAMEEANRAKLALSDLEEQETRERSIMRREEVEGWDRIERSKRDARDSLFSNLRPTLGVEIKMLDDASGNKDCVVVVHTVRTEPPNPAYKAGLKADDIIHKWNDDVLDSKAKFAEKIGNAGIFERAMLTIIRAEGSEYREYELPVVIEGTHRKRAAARTVTTTATKVDVDLN